MHIPGQEEYTDSAKLAESNERFINLLDNDEKRAGSMAQSFIRAKLREDSFLEKILPPQKVQDTDLVPQLETDKPVTIGFKEPSSPAAITLPFGQLPINEIIQGDRFAIGFDRIVTPKAVADVDTLRTYRDIDIRQVFSDNMVKDMGTEQDLKFLAAVNIGISNGTKLPGQVVDATGAVQWQQITGGITRETISEAKTVLMQTASAFAPKRALLNMVTFTKFEAWGRDEMGGDLAQEIAINGMTQRRISGVDYIITIKRDLVPDNAIYWFAAPNQMGKFQVLTDTTMHVKKEMYFIEYCAYKTIGGAIANIASCARTDFI